MVGHAAHRHPNIVQFLGAHLQLESSYIVLDMMKCDLYSALAYPDWTTMLDWRERSSTDCNFLSRPLALLTCTCIRPNHSLTVQGRTYNRTPALLTIRQITGDEALPKTLHAELSTSAEST